MSNYKKIGSIAIGVMFLYIIVKLVPQIAITIGLVLLKPSEAILTIISNILIILILLWLFMARSAIANKLFKDESNIEIEKSITFPQAINLVCIFTGLIVLGSAISMLFSSPLAYKMIKIYTTTENFTKQEINIVQFELFVGLIIKLVIGLYLVFGAPHFVRWQIKRIKKLTEQTIE